MSIVLSHLIGKSFIQMGNLIKIIIGVVLVVLPIIALRIYMVRHYNEQLKDNNEGKGR